MRIQGTTRSGAAFDYATIVAVWTKARPINGYDPQRFRLDACGAIIEFGRHGETIADGTGWEIDHMTPVALGGSDGLFNLQPLQWQNNRAKSDGPMTCAVSARAA